MSDWWAGETRFLKIWKARPRFDVVDGRLTRRQKTLRPPDIWPETREAMFKKARANAATEWAALEERICLVRSHRVLHGIDASPSASMFTKSVFEGTRTKDRAEPIENHLE